MAPPSGQDPGPARRKVAHVTRAHCPVAATTWPHPTWPQDLGRSAANGRAVDKSGPHHRFTAAALRQLILAEARRRRRPALGGESWPGMRRQPERPGLDRAGLLRQPDW